MKVFYSDLMLADIGRHTSPSSMKPKAVAAALLDSGLPITLEPVQPATVHDFERAHDSEFIAGVLSGKIANGFGNHSPDVIRSLPYTTGSLIGAALASLDEKVACSLSSGFHHAGYNFAGGFCTFNGLMVTALHLLAHKKVERVAIIDCDHHYGNGTANIINHLKLQSVFHLSFGEFFHRPHEAEPYLDKLQSLRDTFQKNRPDLIIYQAGADVHVNDPLGGVLSTEQMVQRDVIMFTMARDFNIPICWNLAGGYQRDAEGGISKVIDLHLNTFKAAKELFS